MRVRTAALLAFVILSNAVGNFLLSWGLRSAPAGVGAIASYLQPVVLAGIGLLIAWTVARMFLLGEADLSYVLPVTAVGFVLNAWMGAAWLGERVTPARWMGTLLIFAGAALAGWTPAATVAEERSPQ